MRSTLTAIFVLLSLGAFAQAPNWTIFEYRNNNYPPDKYLVGFSSEEVGQNQNQDQLIERLSNYAKNQLVEGIQTEIKAASTLNMTNVNGDTNEEFKLMSSSSSHATIAGLKVETYVDQGKKTSTAYAFAYTLKSDVVELYENEISKFTENVGQVMASVESDIMASKNENALKKLFNLQTGFREVEHAQAVITTLTGDFNRASLKRAEVSAIKEKTQQKINLILTRDEFSIEDAAWYISRALKLQLKDETQPIRVSNFTYENSPMGSPFSRRFKFAIEQKLIVEGLKVSNRGDDTNDLVLYGTYWEESDRLKVITILRSQQTAEALAGSESFIPVVDLEQKGIAFKPQNYKDALIAEQQFAKDEVKGGDMNIEIWTDKGTENLIYAGGERLKLFVRANKECYIRLVYHLADGSKVLLLDNYYIDRDKVNTVYELPYTFECAEPFGVETLQMNAQNKPFELLRYKSEYGYDFITDDLQTIIKKTRGIKRLSAAEEEDLKAERRLVFTTIHN